MNNSEISKSEIRNPFSLYVHIPYCVRKCPYCDFNSHVVADIPEQAYTAALQRELEHYAVSPAWANRVVKTVFFGGGTPSTFGGSSINAVQQEKQEDDTDRGLEPDRS